MQLHPVCTGVTRPESRTDTVRVYGSTGLIKTLSINDALGASSSSDLYWIVFTFNGTTFTWVNELVSSMIF